ncbi:MAG: 50S ribosomal protein L22 [Clostridia bacterium]
METKVAKAYLRQLRMSPRKVKVVLDLIRNKNAAEAAAILKTTNKIACESLSKLLASAVANAEFNHNMDTEKLYVSECFVTPGMLKNMKRVMPRAKGSAARIIKRTSHITITLKERE